MDLPAIFRRAPELCLVDELAHERPRPGAPEALRGHRGRARRRHRVCSTVNVQHLESLNDRVAELTGVRVRETFPTACQPRRRGGADGHHPEALIQRLRDGNVYPPERTPTALNSFFKVENLSSLREVALRQVAEEVESRRR